MKTKTLTLNNANNPYDAANIAKKTDYFPSRFVQKKLLFHSKIKYIYLYIPTKNKY